MKSWYALCRASRLLPSTSTLLVFSMVESRWAIAMEEKREKGIGLESAAV
jgi:hypothetical protein